MIGLLLVSHRHLAEEMKAVMEHVVGPQEFVETVSIFPSDDMEQRRMEIQEKITALNTGSGVIVLTDMFGGTPSNLAISMMTHDNIEVLAGMNLPMLIKLAQVRSTQSLKEATLSAQEAGKKYINAASVLLNHSH
ncbi:MAG: PTS sugar transporter subunit IIA [Alphaproteobacteria bacterium]|nr:PTS sugar transporter subunit IIA [Alphaproteobacteria bacterium]